MNLWRWRLGQGLLRAQDESAIEEPLEIQVDTRPVSVTMRTPGHDHELAVGFLLSEGLIHKPSHIQSIRPYPQNPSGNALNVFLTPGVRVDFQQLTRHVFASSSCGLCGKASIAAVHRHFKPVRARLKVNAQTLVTLPERMRRRQETFGKTGGLHAAGIFTAAGRQVVIREDIGRHNAVDKVLGFGLLHEKLPYDRHILMVSGRASFEIMQKALAARIPIVAAISAPSSLAIEFARKSGQTLIGFLRGETMNVYAGKQRMRWD